MTKFDTTAAAAAVWSFGENLPSQVLNDLLIHYILSSSTKNRLWRIDSYKGNACGAKRLPCSTVVHMYKNDSHDWSDAAGKIYLANGIISRTAQKVVCCSADSAGRKKRQRNGPQRIQREKSSRTVVEQTVLVKGTMQSFVLKSPCVYVSVCVWHFVSSRQGDLMRSRQVRTNYL